MDLIQKRFDEWSLRTQRRLLRATLEGGYLRLYVAASPQSQTVVAFSKKHLMGWGLVWSTERGDYLNLFVNPRYRKRGVALAIAEKVLATHDRVVCAKWDGASYMFFKKLQRRNPGKVRIEDFWLKQHLYDNVLGRLSQKTKGGRYLK